MFRAMCLINWQSLKELANNLWWSWNSEAEALFRRMDPSLWEEVSHNPKLLLEKIDYKRLLVLEDDDEFVADLEKNLQDIQSVFKTDLMKKISHRLPTSVWSSVYTPV